MENINKPEDFLFTTFGLCPDYKVMRTEGEWVEFYEPHEDIATLWSKLPNDSIPYPKKIRLRLNTHLVELENGMTISAKFAVSHENKIIFILVTPVGEIGRLLETYK